MVGVCECLPHEDNRIELTGNKDKFGMRLARSTFNLDDYARNLWRETADLGVKIFKAAGATEAWHSPPGGQHIMGGTIMGRDRNTSVTNEYAQLHDVPNVIIGGPQRVSYQFQRQFHLHGPCSGVAFCPAYRRALGRAGCLIFGMIVGVRVKIS